MHFEATVAWVFVRAGTWRRTSPSDPFPFPYSILGCISRSTLGALGLGCYPWSSYQVNQVNKVNTANKASEGGWWLMSRPF